jgi:ribonuclease HII
MSSPLCGIDEAGRGPLAGPLVIAGVILASSIEGLDDSKKLTEKRREILYPLICEQGRYRIVSFSAEQIDRDGLSACLHQGLMELKNFFGDGVEYLYDGNTAFGVDGIRTLVRADAQIPEVAAASILAKVTRAHAMIEAARRYPQYGFERHKGYGTRDHIDAILTHGRCAIHRKSFRIKRVDEATLM